MNIAYYDEKGSGLGGFLLTLGPTKICNPQEASGYELVFVHPGDEEECWPVIADAINGPEIIFVSTEPSRFPSPEDTCKKIHYCRYNANSLSGESRMLDFIAGLKSGTLDWSLLALPLYPENLVAVYLACIAKDNDQALNFTGILGAQVQSEFEKQWNLHKPDGPQYNGIWQDAALRDTNNRTQLRNSLHSLFQKVHDEQKRK